MPSLSCNLFNNSFTLSTLIPALRDGGIETSSNLRRDDVFDANSDALIFSIGLAVFCRSLPRPLLALSISIPYLVIVVAMGYTRQGVALGLAMIGLVALSRNQNKWFVFWVLLGVTMHKTAVLLLPIAALTATQNRIWTFIWLGVISLGAYYIFLVEMVEVLFKNYVEAQSQSSGAAVRIAMSIIHLSCSCLINPIVVDV